MGSLKIIAILITLLFICESSDILANNNMIDVKFRQYKGKFCESYWRTFNFRCDNQCHKIWLPKSHLGNDRSDEVLYYKCEYYFDPIRIGASIYSDAGCARLREDVGFHDPDVCSTKPGWPGSIQLSRIEDNNYAGR